MDYPPEGPTKTQTVPHCLPQDQLILSLGASCLCPPLRIHSPSLSSWVFSVRFHNRTNSLCSRTTRLQLDFVAQFDPSSNSQACVALPTQYAHPYPKSQLGKFVEDAKKKEMTGRGRSYLDELLKHEDDPLYWVKADGGANEHDEGVGKIDSQHADGVIHPDTEVTLLDLDSDIQIAASGDDGNGIWNGHTAEQTTTKLPDHPAKPKLFATPSLSPAFQMSSRSPPRLHVRYLHSPLPLGLPAPMTRILHLCWMQYRSWSALHLRPLFQLPQPHLTTLSP